MSELKLTKTDLVHQLHFLDELNRKKNANAASPVTISLYLKCVNYIILQESKITHLLSGNSARPTVITRFSDITKDDHDNMRKSLDFAQAMLTSKNKKEVVHKFNHENPFRLVVGMIDTQKLHGFLESLDRTQVKHTLALVDKFSQHSTSTFWRTRGSLIARLEYHVQIVKKDVQDLLTSSSHVKQALQIMERYHPEMLPVALLEDRYISMLSKKMTGGSRFGDFLLATLVVLYFVSDLVVNALAAVWLVLGLVLLFS